ncbi:unnamed protein product [Peniophora sp. CBMAI 1063]|nr:unnamed protein product [Peniophora sp. CBMAI 1063]
MARLSSDSPKSQSTRASTQVRTRKATTAAYSPNRRSDVVRAWQKLLRLRSPMLYLDERFRFPASPSVPTLHFGLGFTEENIFHCARKHQLLESPYDEEQDDPEQENCRIFVVLMQVKTYLERKLKRELFMQPAISPGYLGVFSLYSNFTREKLYRPMKEGEILATLRRELDVRKPAEWYWDGDHGLGYVCKYAEFNP